MSTPKQVFANYTGTSTSVLLLDTTVAPIEPGFSRLRVDYQDINYFSRTEYFDMPFWEGWDTYPREIEAIVDYLEAAVDFLQTELQNIFNEIDWIRDHELYRGLTASGTITATQATSGLYSDLSQQIAHSMAIQEFENISQSKSNPYSLIPTASELITAVATPGPLYPGDTIVFNTIQTPNPNDKIYLFKTQLSTIVDTATHNLSATIPLNIPYEVAVPFFIGQAGIPYSPIYSVQILKPPVISNISGPNSISFANPGDIFTINGTGFLDNPIVTFSPGLTSTILSVNPNQITGLIPNNAESGIVNLNFPRFSTSTAIQITVPLANVALLVSPHVSLLEPTETQSMSAILNGNLVDANWSILTDNQNIGQGKATYGIIDKNGNYTAPTLVNEAFSITIVANHRTLYGNVLNEATIIVVPNQTTPYNVSPSNIVIYPKYTIQYQLLDGNTPINGGITWYVNGILGGDTTYGLMSQDGIYEAPLNLPLNKSIRIEAYYNGYVTPTAARVSTTFGDTQKSMSIAPHLTSKDPYIERPIFSFSPNPVVLGSPVTITGQNFTFVSPGGPFTTVFLFVNLSGTLGNAYPSSSINVISNNQMTATWPTSVPSGSYFMVVDSQYGPNSGRAATVANNSPTITAILNSNTCPGQNLTIQGTYFGNTNFQVFLVTPNNEIMTLVSGPTTADNINYSAVATLPSNVPADTQNMSLYISSSNGISNTFNFTMPQSCYIPPPPPDVLIVTGPSDVCQGDAAQFKALYNGNDVTGSASWSSNAPGGLFNAPLTPGQNYTVTASYQSLSNGESILVKECTPMYPPMTGCDQLAVEPTTVIVNTGTTQQFVAYLSPAGQNPTPQYTDVSWFVNGFPGGNSVVGTIDDNGLYTAPASMPNFIHVKVSAEYSYQPPA